MKVSSDVRGVRGTDVLNLRFVDITYRCLKSCCSTLIGPSTRVCGCGCRVQVSFSSFFIVTVRSSLEGKPIRMGIISGINNHTAIDYRQLMIHITNNP